MDVKPSIVFVDDQNNILQGFRRQLRNLESEWNIHYSIGGKETLRLMESTPIDVIVSDTNMPGMRGTELLKEVQNLYPQTTRLVLSGGGSRSDDISILLRTSHQFFSKPFDIDKLKKTVDRLLMLRERVGDKKLVTLVSSISKLPCSPHIYAAFKKEREGSSADLDKMGAYIAQDPGLTAKMLQSLNSTYFGVNKAGIHPFKAAQSMGPGTINYLFDEDAHFHTIEQNHPNYAFLAKVYKQSLHAACLLEALAAAENLPESLKNIAYTTGMLGNAGTIILACGLPEAYAKLTPDFKSPAQQEQVEKKALGATHAAVGAYFLGLWGFPEATCTAVGYCQMPDKAMSGGAAQKAPDLTALLHVTQALVQADDIETQKSFLNMPHLESLGLGDKVQKWHDLDRNEIRILPALQNWTF
ncbi:MAG: HDOD domain-containing protein [Alphaproteobacteria bacterium]|nr:HDOD domain-containing protein [Alphaproteobacteria bacterium]MDE2336057.1 HDOD domain-containing protein [Alphaproteobacteria bacterium]